MNSSSVKRNNKASNYVFVCVCVSTYRIWSEQTPVHIKTGKKPKAEKTEEQEREFEYKHVCIMCIFIRPLSNQLIKAQQRPCVLMSPVHIVTRITNTHEPYFCLCPSQYKHPEALIWRHRLQLGHSVPCLPSHKLAHYKQHTEPSYVTGHLIQH